LAAICQSFAALVAGTTVAQRERMRHRFLTVPFLLFCCCALPLATGVSVAAAQAPLHAAEQPAAQPSMSASMRLKLAAAGLGGGALALGGSAAAGLGLYFANRCGHCDEDEADYADIQGIGVASGLTLVSVPLVSSALVHTVGKHAGYRGRYGHAVLGSFAGMAVGSGAGLLMYLAADALGGESNRAEERKFRAGIASASIVGLTVVGAFSMLSYRLSDKRRRTVLSPAVSPSAQQRGLTLGIAGRF
jgi:hypothetical protein